LVLVLVLVLLLVLVVVLVLLLLLFSLLLPWNTPSRYALPLVLYADRNTDMGLCQRSCFKHHAGERA
jgi:hypothetical protein